MRPPSDHIGELMRQSLIAWRLNGRVRGAHDGAVLLSCGEHDVRVERAPPALPFRWTVTIGGRTRGAISVVAVLRQVRTALDPGYAAMRVRVTTFPLVPP